MTCPPNTDLPITLSDAQREIITLRARVANLTAGLEKVAGLEEPAPMPPALRDQIARIIMLDHLQLLHDFDVDGDLYRKDPECADSAYVTADNIIAAMPDTKALEAADKLAEWVEGIIEDGCAKCGGDCSAANPPVHYCPQQEAMNDLAAYHATRGGKA